MSGKRKHSSFVQGSDLQARHIERLKEAEREIERAEVVALDLEFSGLFIDGKKQTSIQAYYQHCSESVPEFLAVQLGLCAARRDPQNANKWILSPFNFHLFPAWRKIFLCDSLTLTWLAVQGFDLRKWVEDGYDYRALASIQHESKHPANEKAQQSGVQRLIETIIELQKPLILHNGMLDLLHVYDKFINELPETVDEFCYYLAAYFSGGVYDTKRIAEEGRLKIYRLYDKSRASTSLEYLYQHLCQEESKLEFVINTDLAAYKAGELEGYDPERLSLRAGSMKPSKQGVPPPIGEQPSPSAPPTLPEVKQSPMSESSVEEREGPASPTLPPPPSPPTSNVPQPPPVRSTFPVNKSHEAGYDAMVTLEVFLYELEWIRRSGEETHSMRAKDPTTLATSIPLDWQSFPLCRNACNNLEIVGISPGKLGIDHYANEWKEAKKRALVATGVLTKYDARPAVAEGTVAAAAPPSRSLMPVSPTEETQPPNTKRLAVAGGGGQSRLVARASRDPVRGTFRNMQAVYRDPSGATEEVVVLSTSETTVNEQ